MLIEPQTLTIARTIGEARSLVGRWRAQGLTVGLVPTMGALHAGHLALVERARGENDRVLATLFVNPLQFGPGEDFAAYPRDNARDFSILKDRACDAVFAPAVAEMFPESSGSLDEAETRVSVSRLSGALCGENRPGHFDGVATIVLRLFMIALPDTAYFGEKDYQQLIIIQRLVRDLNVPVRIAGVPIVRESDGLALSSRNVYLDARRRGIAPRLFETLGWVRDRLAAGEAAPAAVAAGRERLRAAGFERIDYVTLAAGDTLETLTAVRPGARLFGAAVLGRTRLIDTIPAAESAS